MKDVLVKTVLLHSFRRFINGTIQGLNWFLAQMLTLVVLGAVLYMALTPFVKDCADLRWWYLGIIFVFGIWGFIYTMVFNWFYAFIPIKYFIKTFWMPYLMYILLGRIIIYDVQDRLLICLMPLYGMSFTYIAWKSTKRFKGLLTAFLHVKKSLGEITLRKVLLVQTLGIVLIGLLEYFDIHPISTLLGGGEKWDFTSTAIWLLLVVFPAIYAIHYKVKKVWLPILITILPFILIGIVTTSFG